MSNANALMAANVINYFNNVKNGDLDSHHGIIQSASKTVFKALTSYAPYINISSNFT